MIKNGLAVRGRWVGSWEGEKKINEELQIAIDFATGSGDQNDWDLVAALRQSLAECRKALGAGAVLIMPQVVVVGPEPQFRDDAEPGGQSRRGV